MFVLNLQPSHLTLNYGSFAAARSWRRWNPDGGRRLFVSHQVLPLTRAHRHKAERRVSVQVSERNLVFLLLLFGFLFLPGFHLFLLFGFHFLSGFHLFLIFGFLFLSGFHLFLIFGFLFHSGFHLFLLFGLLFLSGFHLLLLFGFLFLPDKLWVLVEQVFYVFSLFFFSLSFLDRKSIMWIYLHLISVVINDKKCVMKLFRKKKNASLNSKTCNAILIFVKILLQKCYRSLYIPPRTGLIITITNMTVVRY